MRKRLMAPTLGAICAAICAGVPAWAQTALTWEQVKAKFETANSTLRAGQLNISESKAQETTAYLKPNPSMTVSVDQFEPFSGNPYRPFGSLLPFVSMDYLHERQHKRELRLESAQQGTGIAETQQLDLGVGASRGSRCCDLWLIKVGLRHIAASLPRDIKHLVCNRY